MALTIHDHISTLKEYVNERKGVFVFLCSGPYKSLFMSIQKFANIKTSCVFDFLSPDRLLEEVEKAIATNSKVTVIVERYAKGCNDDCVFRLGALQRRNPCLSLVFISSKLSDEEKMLFQENNIFITIEGMVNQDILTEKVAEAITPFQDILKLRKAINLCLSMEDFARASQVAKHIAAHDANGAILKIVEGDIQLAQGDEDGALELYTEAYNLAISKKDKAKTEAGNKVCEILLTRGDNTLILKVLESLHADSPLNFSHMHNLKIAYVETGQHDKVLGIVKTIINTAAVAQRKELEAIRLREAEYLQNVSGLHVSAEALAEIVGVKASNRSRALAATKEAEHLAKQENFLDAIKKHLEAVALDRNNVIVRLGYIRTLYRTHRLEQLLEQVRFVKEQFPTYGEEAFGADTHDKLLRGFSRNLSLLANSFHLLYTELPKDKNRKAYLDAAKTYYEMVQRIQVLDEDMAEAKQAAINLIGEIKTVQEKEKEINATAIKKM